MSVPNSSSEGVLEGSESPCSEAGWVPEACCRDCGLIPESRNSWLTG